MLESTIDILKINIEGGIFGVLEGWITAATRGFHIGIQNAYNSASATHPSDAGVPLYWTRNSVRLISTEDWSMEKVKKRDRRILWVAHHCSFHRGYSRRLGTSVPTAARAIRARSLRDGAMGELMLRTVVAESINIALTTTFAISGTTTAAE